MRILVAHASKHGSTAEIAGRVAQVLSRAGHVVDVSPLRPRLDVREYGAVVIGAGVYAGRWPREAREYVGTHAGALADRPVWLFSSGPLGEPGGDAVGCEGVSPHDLPALMERVRPVEHRVFAGRLDPATLDPGERVLHASAAGRAVLPAGDFRDWEAIEGWARGVAAHLRATEVASGTG